MDNRKYYFFYIESSEELNSRRSDILSLFSKYGKVTKLYLTPYVSKENRVYYATLEETQQAFAKVSESMPIGNSIKRVVWPERFDNKFSPRGRAQNKNNSFARTRMDFSSDATITSDLSSEETSTSKSDYVLMNYVDLFGTTIPVVEGEDDQFYVPLNELQKRGMLIVTKEEYPSKIIAHKEIIQEYERYMKSKAVEFLKMHQCEKDIDEGVTDQIVNRSKPLIFKRKDDFSSDEKTPPRKPNNFVNKKVPSPNAGASKATKNNAVTLNIDEIYEVDVTFIKNENVVFVNLVSDTLEKFSLEVNECAEKSQPVTRESLKEGNVYAGLFDKLWYRVLLLNKEKLFFMFVDYGNCAVCKLDELRKLPEELVSKPFQAINIRAADSTKGFEEGDTYFMKPIRETPYGYFGVFKKNKKDLDNTKAVPKKKVQLNHPGLNSTSETESDEVEKLPPLRSSTKRTHREMSPNRESVLEPKPTGVSEVALNDKRIISKPTRKTVAQFNRLVNDTKEEPEEKPKKNFAHLREMMLKDKAAKEETVIDSSDTWGERTTIRHVPEVKNDNMNKRSCIIDKIGTTGMIEPGMMIDEYSFLACLTESDDFEEEQNLLWQLSVDVAKNEPISNANVGDLVLLKHNDDGIDTWARAIVTEVRPFGLKYQCALIDFGQMEILDDIYLCPKDIVDICEFSFVCTTADKTVVKKIRSITDESLKYAIKKPGEGTITIKGTEYTFKVKKWNPFSSETMKKTEVVQKVYKGVSPSYTLTNGDILRIVKEKDGFLYVVTKTCIFTMKEIKQEIQQMKGEVLNAPEIDQVVLSPKPNEDNLHRAIIKEITGDKATVDFIDYAEIGTVPLKVLRNINEKLSKTHCGIIKAPKLTGYVNKQFTPKSLKYIEDCVNDGKKFKVRFCANNEIDLISLDDGTSLNEKLSDLDKLFITYNDVSFYCPNVHHIKMMCLDTSNLKKGTLVFCIFDDYSRNNLKKIEEATEKYVTNNTEPYDASVKEICLAQYDGDWYRAVVVEKNNDTYTVFYLDYGNTSTVSQSQITKIPPELNRFPCCTLYCLFSLEGLQLTPEGIPDTQLKQMNEILKEGELYVGNIVPKNDPESFLIKYTVEIPSVSKKLEYEYDGLF